MPIARAVLTCVALLALAGPASAQASHDGMKHGSMQHGAGRSSGDAPSTAAFKAAAMRMHKDMAIAYTGDTDVDFVRGMIPHHQAAIEMAKIELQYGADEKTKALAQAIIKAQEAEIADMQAWLKAQGK